MDWKSKWNYKVEYIGNVPDELINTFKICQINEIESVNKLSFTNFEKEAIKRVLNFTNLILFKAGYSEINISLNQIIVLEEKEFLEKIGFGRGLTNFGYSYLIRDEKKWRFVRSLSHEVAHLISFYSLEILEKKGKISINLKRTGYLEKEKRNFFYQALNETATEFFTDIIISYIIGSDFLSIEDKKNLETFSNYLPEKLFFDNLINFSTDPSILWKSFLSSFINGKNEFIDLLSKEFPLICKDIRKLETNNEEKLKKILRKQNLALLDKFLKGLSDYKQI